MAKVLFPEKKISHSKRIITGIALTIIIGSLLDTSSCSVEREAKKELCTTQSCKDAVERISRKMDSTIEPCDDFYQFACGSYLNSNESDDELLNDDIELDLIHKLDKKIENQMISILEKDYHDTDMEPLKIAKYLYKTCLNKTAIDEQDLTPFLNILEQAGGWPVLKEKKTWNETAFNWNRVIFKIGNKNYWLNQFLSLSWETDQLMVYAHPSLGITETDLEYDVEDKKNNMNNYFNYMVNIAVSMGASKEYALKELKKSFEFEVKLAEISSGDISEISYKEYLLDNLEKYLTISDLIKKYSFIPWEDYINHKFSINVKQDDKIEVSDSKYFKNLKNLIESTPKRVVANYVMWRHIDYFADYLNKTIRDIKSDYFNVTIMTRQFSRNILDFPKRLPEPKNTNDNKKQESQSTKCYQFLQYSMGTLLNFIHVHEYPNEKTISSISTILNNVQHEFTELVKNVSWMDNETKNRTIDKAMNTTFVFGYPKEFLNTNNSWINELFQNLKFINNSYIENIFNVNMYRSHFNFFPLNPKKSKPEHIKWISCGPWTMTDRVYYSYFKRVSCIPAVYLQDFMYNFDFPMYIKYGRIGNALGRGVVEIHKHSIISPSDDQHTIRETDPWKLQCIIDQYSKFDYSAFPGRRLTYMSDIYDNSGIRAAYFAYKKLSQMDKHQKIKDKVYTPRQMFWISAASFFCTKPNDIEIPLSLWGTSLPKYRIIGSFSNMKEFANDFNCPKDSPMNPTKKCQIW